MRGQLEHVAPENVLVLRSGAGGAPDDAPDFHARARRARSAAPGRSLERPASRWRPTSTLMVIYTSGTTGLPKGILNNHFKLFADRLGRVRASSSSTGTRSATPACRSSTRTRSSSASRPRSRWAAASRCASASARAASCPTCCATASPTGTTWASPCTTSSSRSRSSTAATRRASSPRWREHPAQPAALRHRQRRRRRPTSTASCAGSGSRTCSSSTARPRRRSAPSARRAIRAARVGEITDPAVKILDERGQECPPAAIGARRARSRNYAEAVGEICRVAPDTALFQGYFDNPDANTQKYRDGVYHSGDLGHIAVRDGRRFLYFDGRTDDWIRKDGENFCAAQVARLMQEHPDVALAAAYGVPCAVSDELVMVALEAPPGCALRPARLLRLLRAAGRATAAWTASGSRTSSAWSTSSSTPRRRRSWCAHSEASHFHRGRLPDAPLFWRTRGDDQLPPLRQGRLRGAPRASSRPPSATPSSTD